jgi:hypothetical protein
MTERFNMVLEALSKQLNIELTAKEGIASITIDDDKVLHLAPLGEEQMVMFMHGGSLTDEQQAPLLLQNNFFSLNPYLPRVGLSKDNRLIAWSQHPLTNMDGPALDHAIAELMNFADKLPNNASPAQSSPFITGIIV